jgi:hypothetical protein
MAKQFKRYTSSVYEGIITELMKGNEVMMMESHLNLDSLQQQFRRLRTSWPPGVGDNLIVVSRPDPDNAENLILSVQVKVKHIPFTLRPRV